VDSRGRFYIAAKSGAAILAFGPDGRLLKAIGKPGRGPGEFARIEDIYAGSNDTLFIADGRRIHVLSPDYTYVREFLAEVNGSGLFGTILSGDRMLFDRGNHAFTIVTSAGATLPEVQLEGVDTTSRVCDNCGERVYRAARTPGLIWSGPQNIYRLEQHDTLGKLIKRITREVAWFEPWGGETERRDNSGPLDMFAVPRFFGVGEADDGTLWTHVVGLYDTPREQLMIQPDRPEGQAALFNLIKTRIEAIDPTNNQVLGSMNMPHLTLPLGRGLSALLTVDEAGDWTWKIFRFRAARGSP
jgi:hypothetical protein